MQTNTIVANLLLVIGVIYIHKVTNAEDPIVQTIYGKVRGTIGKSRLGKEFASFRGIPYAKAPVEHLRFRPPQKPTPWTGVHNTKKDGPSCVQKNYLFKQAAVEGSEDCLFINVYSPYIRHKEGGNHLPVMVFVHWGGFFAGYGSSEYLGPEYFMDKDVVLVTFNYRLGVLGFLSTFDDASPGNYGLKDQTAALEWVKDNIANFGGDSGRVTIFGQSAGAASVHFHMLSPLSRGLFQQAISESGTALALWAKPLGPEQLHVAQLQGGLVGCNGAVNDTYLLIDCLRRIDAHELVQSGDKFKFFSIDPLTVYLPSIERRTDDNRKPFLTKQPIEYILGRDFRPVPWIIGMVSDEGIVRAAPLLTQTETRTVLNERFDLLMPALMALFMSTPKEKVADIWRQIKDFYFHGANLVDVNDARSIQGLVNLYTDRSFAYTLYQTALLHSLKGHASIWLYNFKYRGRNSYGELFAATDDKINYEWGVSHCDELLYLFRSPAILPELERHNDVLMSEILIRIWTNFAAHGHPTPPSSNLSYINEEWLPLKSNFSVRNKNMRFLNITGNHEKRNSIQLNMEYGFYRNRFKFWEELPLVENIDDLCQKHIEL